MWLPWTWALVFVACFIVAMLALRQFGHWPTATLAARELALIFTLYAVWQLAGSLSFAKLDSADEAGLWLARLEHTLHLPSEAFMQQAITGHDWLMRAADLYYAGVHVPVLLITLAWVFAVRRPNWPFARTTVALLTLSCLAIQYIPVAPPRLLPSLHIVDTAARDGLSVYSAVAGANQYAAMPSLHVGWAAAAALIIIVTAKSRWRWLSLLYPAVTTWVVVVTGNHFWLDGAVALLLLALAVGVTWLFPSQRPNQDRMLAEPTAVVEPVSASN